MHFLLILSMLNIVYNTPGGLWITFYLLAPLLGLLFSCGLRLSAKAHLDYIHYFPPTEGLLWSIRFTHSMLSMIFYIFLTRDLPQTTMCLC